MLLSKTRKALESTYSDTCTVYGFEKVKVGSVTRNEKKVICENIKCALSQKSSKTTNQTDTANTVSYDAKLFIAPEIEIEPGSKIEVLRLGKAFSFVSSGEPFLYETHKEIMLLRSEKA